MRLRGRSDANQDAIVEALRDAGASVQIISAIGRGCPDLLVGFRRRNLLFECKDGSKKPSARRLTDSESNWIESWRGEVYIVCNPGEAISVLEFIA